MRVSVSVESMDWKQPYNRSGAGSSVGTAFVLAGVHEDTANSFLVVTAYHVVERAKQILVRVEGEISQLVLSELVACNPDLDVALLRVPIALPACTQPLALGDSDTVAPLDRVQVQGYATGAAYVQYTTGVVSGRTPLKLQIDAAVNGGNSGGPVLCAERGCVLGVVTHSNVNRQNMNFACPMREALDSLRRAVRTGVLCQHPPSLNAKLTPTPQVVLEHLGVAHGATCSHVHPASGAHAAGLRRGDVVTRLAEYDVHFDGTVRPTFWEGPVHYTAVVLRGAVGDRLALEYVRAADGRAVRAEVALEQKRNVFRDAWPELDGARYCTHGGLVVQPLLPNHIRDDPGFKARFAYLMMNPELKMQSVLVVTHVSADSPFGRSHGVSAGDVVLALNGAPVHVSGGDPFEQYVRGWRAIEGTLGAPGVVRVTMRDGNAIAASHADVAAANLELRERRVPLVSARPPDMRHSLPAR
jgi:S1-C subfamily serine protease